MDNKKKESGLGTSSDEDAKRLFNEFRSSKKMEHLNDVFEKVSSVDKVKIFISFVEEKMQIVSEALLPKQELALTRGTSKAANEFLLDFGLINNGGEDLALLIVNKRFKKLVLYDKNEKLMEVNNQDFMEFSLLEKEYRLCIDGKEWEILLQK